MDEDYTAIYTFGDSLSDAGDAYLTSTSPLGRAAGLQPEPVSPPYAREVYGDTEADVFTDGPVWVQDLAGSLGLPAPAPGEVGATGEQLAAAGISPSAVAALDGGDPGNYVVVTPGAAGGTDFAIGGSVTGPTDFNTSGKQALTDLKSQIANFQHEIPSPAPDALYTVWSGSNDILDLIGSSQFQSQSAETSRAEVAQSAQNEVDAVVALIRGGARTVLVGDVPDLGLTPAVRAQGSAAEQAATAYAQYFNSQLRSDLDAAAGQIGDASVRILDVFGLLDGVTPGTTVPGANGGTLTDTTDRAYTGSYTADDGTVAPDADSYLFFDGLHPTRTGHQAIANQAAADLAAPVCFCTGTRILTARGEVAVEALEMGDLAVTASGAHRPVRWIGRQTIDCAAHPRPREVMPVRVQAGALGEGRPARDLWVSPGHALCLDLLGEVLVPASALVNGATVAQVEVEHVTYWHVELDGHDVLLADGVPAESYIDTGNRAFFGTGRGALDPERAPASLADYCRPFHDAGPLVAAARAQLRLRAGALGWRLEGAPLGGLHLAIDGARLEPEADGLSVRFAVPAGARDVWLCSDVAVPLHGADDARADPRPLGLCVARIGIDDGLTGPRPVAPGDPRLAEGWHAAEPDHRWTAGCARLDPALWAGCRGLFFLRVELARASLPGWRAPEGLALGAAPRAEGGTAAGRVRVA